MPRTPGLSVDCQRMREARKRVPLSIAELAKAVGKSREHIRNVEEGRSGASAALVRRIAEVLQVQPGDLVQQPGTDPAKGVSLDAHSPVQPRGLKWWRFACISATIAASAIGVFMILSQFSQTPQEASAAVDISRVLRQRLEGLRAQQSEKTVSRRTSPQDWGTLVKARGSLRVDKIDFDPPDGAGRAHGTPSESAGDKEALEFRVTCRVSSKGRRWICCGSYFRTVIWPEWTTLDRQIEVTCKVLPQSMSRPSGHTAQSNPDAQIRWLFPPGGMSTGEEEFLREDLLGELEDQISDAIITTL